MKREEAIKRYSEAMRMMRYSENTIKSYSDHVGAFITFLFNSAHGKTRDEQISEFLTIMVVSHHVNAATQKQALCALAARVFDSHALPPLNQIVEC